MKFFCIVSICLLFAASQLFGQSSLNFTVTQLPLLTADAGKDTVVLKGDKIRLGGTIVASGGSGSYQFSWLPTAGLDSPFIARPFAIIDTTITYQLTVDDGQSCKKNSIVKLTVNRVTATSNIFNESGISIYPNPAKSFFFIISEKPILEKTITIDLYDLSGRKIYSEEIKGNRRLNEEVRTPAKSRGMYILKVSGGKNNLIRKIIFL